MRGEVLFYIFANLYDFWQTGDPRVSYLLLHSLSCEMLFWLDSRGKCGLIQVVGKGRA